MSNEHKVLAAILFVFSILLYVNTLNHNYVLDDFSVIKENTIVQKGIEGIPQIWKTHYREGYGYTQGNLFRPLPLSLFAVQWQIAPDNPSFAHWFNVLAYALLGILIFYFIECLLGKEHRFIAFLTAALFIAHPIHTEVVANIKSIDDILAMGFSLFSIILLLKYLNSRNKKWLGFSIALYGLAFLSKESTVTFLAVIPLILVFFRGLKWLSALQLTSWYLIPFGLYLLLRINALGSLGGNKTIARIDNLLIAAPTEIERLATAIKIMGLYLWKLIFPHPLMNDYSLKQISIVGFDNITPWLALIAYGFIIYLMIVFWRKNKTLAFAIAFFLITISLYSNIFYTIGTSFGERLLFIPSLGFCLILAFLIQMPFTINHLQILSTARTPLLLSSVLLMIYSFKTIDRNKAWKDNYTLYSTDVLNCSRSARCQYYHGLGLMKEKAVNTGNQQEKQNYLLQAIGAFNKATAIYPGYSDAWGQIGLAYYRLNNFSEAEKAYLKATEINPHNASVYSNLGSLYFQSKRYQAARQAYESALGSNPNHIDALANYASTLGTLGEYQSAITYFKRAIALKPNEASYYQMVGITYKNLGDEQQANVYLQKAQQLSKAP